MDIAASEWSNGCESGWTGYLDESYISRNDNNFGNPQSYRINNSTYTNVYDYEEDLSMVSDASSGPPHFCQEIDDDQLSYNNRSSSGINCYATSSEKTSRKDDKKKTKKSSKEHEKVVSSKHQNLQYHHHLDDTASSPAISHSQMYGNPSNMGFSHSMSTTHFQEISPYNNHYSFWQSSHLKDTDHSAQPSQLTGRGWE